MPLLTPLLKQQLAMAFQELILDSGVPPTPEQIAKCQKIAGKIADAMETYIKAATVNVTTTVAPAMMAAPGTIATAGSPAAQVSVAPVPIAPIPLSGIGTIS